MTRTLGQAVRIGDDVRVVLMEIRGKKQVRLGIEAPANVQLFREEVTPEERAQYQVDAEGAGEG